MRIAHWALAASVLMLATIEHSSAADVPAKLVTKAPPSVPVANWSGVYVYGGFGAGMFNLDTTLAAPTGAAVLVEKDTQGGKGWFGTIGIGYDYQFTDRIVGGVFGDYDFGSIKGTVQDQTTFSVGTMKLESAWSVGARAGWLLTPSILTYFNAGYTQAQFSGANMTVNNVAGFAGFAFGDVISTIPSHTYSGWFLGSGVEANIAPGWFWRTEYRVAEYSSATLPVVCAAAAGCGPFAFGAPVGLMSIEPTVQTVRTQLAYKFNSGVGSQAYAAAFRQTAAAPQNWSGFYVNAGGGYGMYNADTTWFSAAGGPFLPGTQTQGGRGWFGTVGGGYDRQFTDRIVAGVFADYDFANLEGTIQDQGIFALGTMKLESAWSAGGRVGWLITPSILTYFNAGYTEAHFSGADLKVNIVGGSVAGPLGTLATTLPSHTYGGWFLGGGVETKVASNWIWRSEYRYADYGDATLPTLCAIPAGCGPAAFGAPTRQVTIHPYVQTVRSALVYKFQ
jgi:outer membrane immunogenic protein